MAWSSDESDDDEEAQKRDEENRTALFRRQPSSLETRSQKARAPSADEDAELERALARAEEAERRRAAGDAELERALAASNVTAAAEASRRSRASARPFFVIGGRAATEARWSISAVAWRNG